MMISSDTSCPASMTFFAAMPSGVPAFTAARSMSPVEICGMWKRSLMKLACVPLPAPGGPRRISLIIVLGNRGGAPPDEAKLPFMLLAVKQCPGAFQIVKRVHAGERRVLPHRDRDGEAMPERAQLFQRLESLERRALEPGIGAQEIGAVGVDTDMPVAREPLRERPRRSRESIPGPGKRRPAEI